MAEHRPHKKPALSDPPKRKSVIKPPEKKAKPNLSRDEQRFIDKKKQEKKRKLLTNLVLFIIAVLFICVGIVLVFSLFFKINIISVKGENIYSDKMVTEKSGVEFGSNLFRVNEEQLSEKLSEELPYIKGVTLERKLPDTLVINVHSTKEVAAFADKGAFVLIDETGKVLDKDSSVLSENVPVVTGVRLYKITEGKQIELTSDAKTKALVSLLQSVKKAEFELLTEINLKNIDDIKIIYDDRITLEVGSLDNIDTKLARGLAALEKENEINSYSRGTLDLKLEPYVYFKSEAKDNNKKENTKKQQK